MQQRALQSQNELQASFSIHYIRYWTICYRLLTEKEGT